MKHEWRVQRPSYEQCEVARRRKCVCGVVARRRTVDWIQFSWEAKILNSLALQIVFRGRVWYLDDGGVNLQAESILLNLELTTSIARKDS